MRKCRNALKAGGGNLPGGIPGTQCWRKLHLWGKWETPTPWGPSPCRRAHLSAAKLNWDPFWSYSWIQMNPTNLKDLSRHVAFPWGPAAALCSPISPRMSPQSSGTMSTNKNLANTGSGAHRRGKRSDMKSQ